MLADLIFGRWVVEAQFGWEPTVTALPGRCRDEATTLRRIDDLRRQGKYREARVLRPALVAPRRQRSRGPRITVGGAA